MTDPFAAVLLAVLIVATSIWVGGFVAIYFVARTASATLDPSSRVAFFRSFGRSYLRVAVPALLVALAVGAAEIWGRRWDGLLAGTGLVAAALVGAFGLAVVQARRMTRLRRRALDQPADQRLADWVRSGGRAAAALRGLIGALSLALVVFGSFLATN